MRHEPNAAAVVDGWSVRMTGTVTFPAAGTYGISLADDDGGRLYVDDRLVVDDWNPGIPQFSQWASTSATVVSGAAGEKHRIQVETKDVDGEDLLQLAWSGPSAGNLAAALLPNLGIVTSTTGPDGVTTATNLANPAAGTTAGTTTDPTTASSGLSLLTATASDSYGRPTGKRLPANNSRPQSKRIRPGAHDMAHQQPGQPDVLQGHGDGRGNRRHADAGVCLRRGRPVDDGRPRSRADTDLQFGVAEPVASATNSPLAGRNTNRTQLVDSGGVTTTYKYDQADRLTQVPSDSRYSTGSITYDALGNMKTLGGNTMLYDVADRPITTTVPTTPTATTVTFTCVAEVLNGTKQAC